MHLCSVSQAGDKSLERNKTLILANHLVLAACECTFCAGHTVDSSLIVIHGIRNIVGKTLHKAVKFVSLSISVFLRECTHGFLWSLDELMFKVLCGKLTWEICNWYFTQHSCRLFDAQTLLDAALRLDVPTTSLSVNGRRNLILMLVMQHFDLVFWIVPKMAVSVSVPKVDRQAHRALKLQNRKLEAILDRWQVRLLNHHIRWRQVFAFLKLLHSFDLTSI